MENEKKRGPKPIGDEPMSSAERTRRRNQKLRDHGLKRVVVVVPEREAATVRTAAAVLRAMSTLNGVSADGQVADIVRALDEMVSSPHRILNNDGAGDIEEGIEAAVQRLSPLQLVEFRRLLE